MTDARGAVTTLGYNNRHLPISINYTVPTGVAASTAVSFAYDAAGNRTQMRDVFGVVNYQYDTLSRLVTATLTARRRSSTNGATRSTTTTTAT